MDKYNNGDINNNKDTYKYIKTVISIKELMFCLKFYSYNEGELIIRLNQQV